MDRISVGGGAFTTEDTELAKPKAWGTERKTEEAGLEEIARRYLLQPVGGFSPGLRTTS